MATPAILKGSTRFPAGVTNVRKLNPLGILEMPSPVHQIVYGWTYAGAPGLPTGNTPATNADFTVTSTTTTGTASLADAGLYPPRHLLTTGTTANDQVVIQDKRTLKANMLTGVNKVLIAGYFRITSTVANSKGVIGFMSGTSNSSLGNDQFVFNWSGATLNFVNRNNGGTALTTAISTSLTVNTLYAVAAILDPLKGRVLVGFGQADGLDLKLSSRTPAPELPLNSSFSVTSSNIPDGTNTMVFSAGAQTTAGAAATVEFGPCFGVIS